MDDADLDRAALARPHKRLESYYTILTYFVVTGSVIYCSCLYLDAEIALDSSRQQFGNEPPVSIGIVYNQIEIKPVIEDEENFVKELDKPSDTRYILLWTPNYPYTSLQGNFFIDNKCPYTNCYVTENRSYFPSHGDFDAILFTRSNADNAKYIESFPINRHPWQKYIFATLETSCSLPISNPVYDYLYNWTWTNRLRSEIYWSKFGIYDMNFTLIGPALNMTWRNITYDTISKHFKNILRGKTKLAAWISDWKYSESEKFVYFLKKELERYNSTIDIFDTCGIPICTNATILKMLEKDYYFYLSFEDTFEDDYVTESLLIALTNKVVPVVYGAANYSRFLPPGSYLNALNLGPEKLADAMISIVKNLTSYYEFFKWTNHYMYKASDTKTELCNICTALNDEEKVMKRTIYSNFCKWWNGHFKRETCEPMPDVKAIQRDQTLIRNITINNKLMHDLNLSAGNKLNEKIVAEMDYELDPIFLSDSSVINGNLTNETSFRDKYKLIESPIWNNKSTTELLILDRNFSSKSPISDESFTPNSLILDSNSTTEFSLIGNLTTESIILDKNLTTKSLILEKITNNSSFSNKNLTDSLIG